MPKLRATLVVEYEADPAHYETDDPAEMARVDAENWTGDVMMLLASFDNDDFKVTVEPLDTETRRAA